MLLQSIDSHFCRLKLNRGMPAIDSYMLLKQGNRLRDEELDHPISRYKYTR